MEIKEEEKEKAREWPENKLKEKEVEAKVW